MKSDVRQWPLDALARGRMKRIVPGRGRGVAVFSGRLWITQLGDPRDFFITAGQTLHFAPRGEVLIEALDDSRFALFDGDPAEESDTAVGYEAAWMPPGANRHPALAVAAGA